MVIPDNQIKKFIPYLEMLRVFQTKRKKRMLVKSLYIFIIINLIIYGNFKKTLYGFGSNEYGELGTGNFIILK